QPGEVVEAGSVLRAVLAQGRAADGEGLQAGRLGLAVLAQFAVGLRQLAQAAGQLRGPVAGLQSGLLAGPPREGERLRVAALAQKDGDLFVELADRRVSCGRHGVVSCGGRLPVIENALASGCVERPLPPEATKVRDYPLPKDGKGRRAAWWLSS